MSDTTDDASPLDGAAAFDEPAFDEPASGVDDAAGPKKAKKKGKKKKRTTIVVEQVVPGGVRWVGAVAGLVIVALGATTLSQAGRVDDLQGQARDRTDAARVAGEFTETLFTFDGADPTANLDRLKELATKAYQPKVDDARQTALAGGTEGQTEAAMSAHVTDVFLTELDGDRAHAVSRADWLLEAGGQRLGLDLYLRIDLERVGGTWKVDEVTALTAKQPGGSSTSTTAPSDTSPPSTNVPSTDVPSAPTTVSAGP
jgi:hypothetical protein